MTTQLEIYDINHDDGVGTGLLVNLIDGQLVAADPNEAASVAGVIRGQHLRNPTLTDTQLAEHLTLVGWSNGYAAIRGVPSK
jgi:hypothetical protein